MNRRSSKMDWGRDPEGTGAPSGEQLQQSGSFQATSRILSALSVSVLVASRDDALCTAVSGYLTSRGGRVRSATDVDALGALVRSSATEVVVIDDRAPWAATAVELVRRHLPAASVLGLVSKEVAESRYDRTLTFPFRAGSLRDAIIEVYGGAAVRSDDAVDCMVSLYRAVVAGRHTGVMSVECGEVRREVFFADGIPVASAGGRHEEWLGGILVLMGMVNFRSLDDALHDQDTLRLGDMLMRRGLISRDDLDRALDRQVFERCVGCFGERRASVRFVDDDSWLFRTAKRPQNPVGVVIEGVRRSVERNRAAADLLDYAKRPLGFGPAEKIFRPFIQEDSVGRLVWWAVDGRRTVGDMLVKVDLPQSDILSVIWTMVRLGIVE